MTASSQTTPDYRGRLSASWSFCAVHGRVFRHGLQILANAIMTRRHRKVDLHRRCWIGRGGTTPAGCIRVSASALGYQSDLDFVFPSGCGVFKAGGDLAFHHGGPSLQELLVPVVTIRMKVRDSERASPSTMTVSGLPDAVTNRIFSVTLQLGGSNLSLFSSPTLVRPLLMSSGKQVGAVGMAIDAELDRATSCVRLQPGKPATVAFLLSDESAASVRVRCAGPRYRRGAVSIVD